MSVEKTVVFESDAVKIVFVWAQAKNMLGYYSINNKRTNKTHKCAGETRTHDAMRHTDDAEFGRSVLVWEHSNANGI